MNEFLTAIWLAIQGKLVVLAILMFLDIFLGILLAVISKTFNWEKLTSFLKSDGLPVLGWIIVVVITFIPKEFVPDGFTIPFAADVTYGLVFLKIFGSLMKSLSDAGVLTELFGKLGVPSAGGKIEPPL